MSVSSASPTLSLFVASTSAQMSAGLAARRVVSARPRPLSASPASPTVSPTVAISALELGAQPADPIVRLPVAIGAFVLAVVTADAVVRVWRSAWAWLPVNRGRGLFRFVWVAVLVGVLVAAVAAFGWAVLVG